MYLGNIHLKRIIPIDTPVSLDSDPYFGIQYLINDTATFFVTLHSDSLKFINIFDSSRSFSTDIKQNFTGSADLLAKVCGKYIYFLETTSRSVLKYEADLINKKLILQKATAIPEALLNAKDRYIRHLENNSIEVQADTAYIAYGLNQNSAQNFLDKIAYVPLDLNNPDSFLQIPSLPVPKRYLKGKSYYASTYLVNLSDSQLLFGYSEYDSLYIYNRLRNSIEKRILISPDSKFFDFEKKKFTNLAYIRKHTLIDEANVNMVVNKLSKQILIIKRLPKKSIIDKSVFEYYLYDTQLNLKLHNKFYQNVLVDSCIPFGEGFLFFDKDRKNVYYYEGN